jgi:hypothetical protein
MQMAEKSTLQKRSNSGAFSVLPLLSSSWVVVLSCYSVILCCVLLSCLAASFVVFFVLSCRILCCLFQSSLVLSCLVFSCIVLCCVCVVLCPVALFVCMSVYTSLGLRETLQRRA